MPAPAEQVRWWCVSNDFAARLYDAAEVVQAAGAAWRDALMR